MKKQQLTMDDKMMNTDTAICSYPSLDKRSSYKGQEGKFEVTLLYKKLPGNKKCAAVKKIEVLLDKTAEDAFGEDYLDDDFQYPLRDGDATVNAKGKKCEPPYPGFWYIKATNGENAPGCVDRQLNDIEASAIYGGCYIRTKVLAVAYDNITKGVKLNLRSVQFVKDGKPFRASRDAKLDFKALEEESDDPGNYEDSEFDLGL